MNNMKLINLPIIEVIQDDKTLENLKLLIEKNASLLSGCVLVYDLYKKEDNLSYALLYVDYDESNEVKENNIISIVKKDAAFLKQMLSKNKNINLDYFFIMPYFNFLSREKGSVLLEPVLTL